MMRALAVLAVVLGVAFAGCSGSTKTTATDQAGTSKPPLDAGKGAIQGLLIDDVYRPIPNGLVLLQGTGLTATTDDLGQFTFVNIEPGSYVALATAAGHEAAPTNVDVAAGQYSDLEVQARRLFSQDGAILTTQYSVFIDCSAEALVYAATGIPCTGDTSGDSDRIGYTVDLRPDAANITYVVTEVKFNQKGDYSVDLGLVDSTNTYTTYYAEADSNGGDYVKITNQPNMTDTNPPEDVGNRNVNFTLDPPFEVTIFPHGLEYGTFHSVCPPATPETNAFCFWGAGPALAVKANIIQSVFLGKPTVDVGSYHVLQAST